MALAYKAMSQNGTHCMASGMDPAAVPNPGVLRGPDGALRDKPGPFHSLDHCHTRRCLS